MRFNIPQNITRVLDMLEDAGYEAYVVGGCVRDLCRGVMPHDYDVTTSALPEETKMCFADFRVVETGIKHGTVTVISEGAPVEITTYRTDGEYKDNRHPESVSFTGNLSLDLSRRDFTVNAMAYSPRRGLYDLYGGKEHIEKRVISCVGDPDRRFGEDGLRILRALRFASTLDFEISPETAESVHRNAHLLKNISAERIFSELSKLLVGKGARRILSEYGDVIALITPTVEEDYEDKVRVIGESDADLHLRLAVLLRDDEREGDLRRLKSDGVTIRAVKAIKELYRRDLSDKVAFRHCRRRYTADIIEKAVKMKYFSGNIDEKERDRKLSLLCETENDCVSPAGLKVTGTDLKEMGVPEGRAIGETLEHLLRLVIADVIPNERETLLREAAEHIKNKP